MKQSLWFPRLVAAGIWLIGIAPVFSPPRTASAVYTVTTTDDILDGACDGHCSLREAIQAANANPGLDTITFGLPGTQTYPISRAGAHETNNQTGDFNIKDSLILDGIQRDATIIDGAGLDRVFYIHPGTTVTLTQLTIQDGLPPADDNLGGGGILNYGTLSLEKVLVRENNARQGAGISNALSYVKVTNSTIEDNGSLTTNEGGGIYSDGDLDLTNTSILDNTALRGGGVSGTESADMYFSGVLFSGNQASTQGGAIYNDKQITLLESTLSGNQADYGGGIYSNYLLDLKSVTINNNTAFTSGGGLFNEGTADLTNVTLSANSAGGDPDDDAGGGGIFNEFHLNLTHVTFYGNNAIDSGSLFNNDGRVLIANTIFARNGADRNCYNFVQGIGNGIISLGRNLEDRSPTTCGLSWVGDIKGVDPELDVLTLEGDFNTATHKLQPGSPAIDTGRLDYCEHTDQRGVFRPVDGDEDGESVCDIGAYELVTAGFVSFNKPEYTEAADGVHEGTGPVDVTVIVILDREPGKDQAVSVDYTYWTPPIYDFVPFSGTLSWGAGESTAKQFTITILDDEYYEPEKFIDAILQNARFGIGVHPTGITRLVVPANDPFGIGAPPPIYIPLIIRPQPAQ